ncbi:hypothetical protein HDU67_004243 [Dinochytrium kinnereticum]|nr:hypothetical protein HDU67_004243 [Dinochytrium kinnereticum]
MYRKRDKHSTTAVGAASTMTIPDDPTSTPPPNPTTMASPKAPRKAHPSTTQATQLLNLDLLPTPILKRILKHSTPHLSRLRRLSKGFRQVVGMVVQEWVKTFREMVEENECWSQRPCFVPEDLGGCDPLVVYRILWDVYAPRIVGAAAGVVDLGKLRGAEGDGGGVGCVGGGKESLGTSSSGMNTVNPGGGGGRAGTTNSAMGSHAVQPGLARLAFYQRQLFRTFRVLLDRYEEGGWASISPLKEFIRKTRLQYTIPGAACSAPALSLLADGASAAIGGGVPGVAATMIRRPSGGGVLLSSILETTGGGGDVPSIEDAENVPGASPSNGPTPLTTSLPKTPSKPSTTTSTSTATATLLTAQDIRPRPPRDPTWYLLNADLCRLASAYGHPHLLPALPDLDPEATPQLLPLSVSDATRHGRLTCLTSLMDAARFVPGALWRCLERGLGAAVVGEEDGCPVARECVVALMEVACFDRLGPGVWVEETVLEVLRGAGVSLGGGGVGSCSSTVEVTSHVYGFVSRWVAMMEGRCEERDLAMSVLEKVDECRKVYGVAFQRARMEGGGCGFVLAEKRGVR